MFELLLSLLLSWGIPIPTQAAEQASIHAQAQTSDTEEGDIVPDGGGSMDPDG